MRRQALPAGFLLRPPAADLAELVKVARQVIPRCGGPIVSQEWKKAPSATFVTGPPRPRLPSEQKYGGRKSKARLPSVRGRDRGPAQPSRELGGKAKTVAMGRKRATVVEMKTGPCEP